MLSAVLRSDIAIQVSIRIMKTFVELRRYLAHGALLLERVSELEIKQLESDYKRIEFEQKTEKKLDEIKKTKTNYFFYKKEALELGVATNEFDMKDWAELIC